MTTHRHGAVSAIVPSLAIASLLFIAPSIARASPWTLPRGEIVIVGGYSYQTATTEVLEAGDERDYPLRGRYTGSSYYVGVRAGFTDELELELSVPIRVVSFACDPVLLATRDPLGTESELDFYQRNVVNFSRTTSGIGDLGLAARYRLLRGPIALAGEARLKAPTGYDPPEGTFGGTTSAAEFAADTGRFATPDNVRDDVTLGDGQLDASLSVLAGWVAPTRTFVRLDAGYNLRLGGAGDQFVGALRAGQAIGAHVLIYAGASLAYSVEHGDVIGVSVAAVNPNVAAVDYGGTANLLLREVQLYRDAVDFSAGVIFKVSAEMEINAGFGRTLWGRNTAIVTSASISFAIHTSVDREEEVPVEAPVEPEPEPETTEPETTGPEVAPVAPSDATPPVEQTPSPAPAQP